MPVARAEGWRARAGIHAASALTSTYNIIDLPLQADQNDACPWTIDSGGTTPPTYARITGNADLSESPDGFMIFAWRMSYMTFGMLNHWLTTFLPGGVQDAPVTVMTYTDTDVAMFLTARMKRPVFPGPDAQYAVGGWGNVMWRFKLGVQIFP